MAFDGITIANIASDIDSAITGGRISKIAQPEKDELLITIKNNRESFRLLISASASLPLIYLTEYNKPSPMTAPNFCMLLRKHIGSGKIVSITQPALERIIRIGIEHLNELGDLCKKYLIVEIMGKHSNIIFTNDDDMIIDSIKHVPPHMSSVREVLPGRPYFVPQTQDKLNPLDIDEELFISQVLTKPMTVTKALYTTLTGLSPLCAEEICFRASIDGGDVTKSLTDVAKSHLYHTFSRIIEDIKERRFEPNIVYQNQEPIDFSSISLSMYDDLESKSFVNISQLLEIYYAEKNVITRIRQKSVDLRKIVTTVLERNIKKYQLQEKQMKDTEKKEKYRIYGELINTYGYNVNPGDEYLEALNYYNNETIRIPLDPTITPLENAQKHFERYNKFKRTADALDTLLADTSNEIKHLESIKTSLDMAFFESDLAQIKEELIQYGYMKRKHFKGKAAKIISQPLHYISSDGYHMYVGKNNFQNEELTFKVAAGDDWWFHAKGLPGSHVIVKTNGDEIPDLTFEEAGRLAAFYSQARKAPKVEVDYTLKRNIKKPNGGVLGLVIYHQNYSLMIEPDISNITKIDS